MCNAKCGARAPGRARILSALPPEFLSFANIRYNLLHPGSGLPALDLVNNPVYHARSKQILAKYHFVRDRVHNEKEMTLVKISASQMGADMLTKNASVGVVRHNKKLLGMM